MIRSTKLVYLLGDDLELSDREILSSVSKLGNWNNVKDRAKIRKPFWRSGIRKRRLPLSFYNMPTMSDYCVVRLEKTNF